MRIVIGTLPDVKRQLERDLHFVKASAVYATEISYYSPTFLGTDPFIDFQTRDLADQIFYLALLYKDPVFVQGEILTAEEKQPRIEKAQERFRKFQALLADLSDALESNGPQLESVVKRITSQISPYVKTVGSIWSDTKEFVKRAKELRRASELGLISVKRFVEVPNIYYNQARLVESLYEEIATVGSFGLLDERFYAEDILPASKPTKRRVAEVASSIFAHLPSFAKASFDEIADIKEELSKYSVQFHKGLFDLADSIKSEPFEPDFIHEVESMVISKVLPSINQIEEAVKSNSYLRELTDSLVRNPLTVPSSSGLGLILGNSSVVPSEIGTVVSTMAGAALISYDAYRSWKEKNRIARTNELFLVHRLQQRIAKI